MKRFYTYAEYEELIKPIEGGIEAGDSGHIEMHKKLVTRANMPLLVAEGGFEKWQGVWYNSATDEVISSGAMDHNINNQRNRIVVFGDEVPESTAADDLPEGTNILVFRYDPGRMIEDLVERVNYIEEFMVYVNGKLDSG